MSLLCIQEEFSSTTDHQNSATLIHRPIFSQTGECGRNHVHGRDAQILILVLVSVPIPSTCTRSNALILKLLYIGRASGDVATDPTCLFAFGGDLSKCSS